MECAFVVTRNLDLENITWFGVTRANGGNGIDVEGDAIALSVNTLASDSADFIFSFDYGKLETNASKDTSWSINADYVMQFGDADATHSLFRPYAGLGIGYLRDPVISSLVMMV